MAKPNVISKDDLIKYAKECLVDKGIEKFTLRAVADTAGVTQGTIYYHFKTKEQLLIDIVQDICETSWQEISLSREYVIEQAITSAKSRCSYDSFFHKLFLSLVASSFNNEKIRGQLGEIIMTENKALTENVSNLWTESPIEGVSPETWGILLNAIADGVALQALLQKDFPVEKTYKEFTQLINGLNTLASKEGD
ncbi:TetR/AcrR family transcriptional regulator [Bacillus norwichensis]|uniref:TetR/AcrR family transcriptional regulator n=1 Tax=Bacillus norwichensis TaxID=2762217 RepID=A0ABR8VS17_9BACI|nr:TetR/AcrR family transcriptional regulator [Bacillus norwichensis]MBD8007562.1 TetR/AcrR family transcriptional regulator [Bacillus norwichensis]